MSRTIKTRQLPAHIAVDLFIMLNPGDVWKKYSDANLNVIVTSMHPSTLNYPEGWYYAAGYLRNRVETAGDRVAAIPLISAEGQVWSDRRFMWFGK